MGWDPGLKARGYAAERRSAACSKVFKVHEITRAYCPRMGRLVFRVRPLYRFVRERLTGLSRGGWAGARSQDSGVSENPGSISVTCAVGCERSEAKGGRIEDASLQNSSCCSSSCLLPSLRPQTRDYIVDVGTLAPLGAALTCVLAKGRRVPDRLSPQFLGTFADHQTLFLESQPP